MASLWKGGVTRSISDKGGQGFHGVPWPLTEPTRCDKCLPWGLLGRPRASQIGEPSLSSSLQTDVTFGASVTSRRPCRVPQCQPLTSSAGITYPHVRLPHENVNSVYTDPSASACLVNICSAHSAASPSLAGSPRAHSRPDAFPQLLTCKCLG